MCTRVVTYNALSARRAYRLLDISTGIDAHITGLTGTRLPFYRPWDGSSHKFTVAQYGRHFEVRWEYEQTRFSNMSARSVHSCEQEILEAVARGKNIRGASEVARKSGGHGAPKLTGGHHRDRDVLPSKAADATPSNLL